MNSDMFDNNNLDDFGSEKQNVHSPKISDSVDRILSFSDTEYFCGQKGRNRLKEDFEVIKNIAKKISIEDLNYSSFLGKKKMVIPNGRVLPNGEKIIKIDDYLKMAATAYGWSYISADTFFDRAKYWLKNDGEYED